MKLRSGTTYNIDINENLNKKLDFIKKFNVNMKPTIVNLINTKSIFVTPGSKKFKKYVKDEIQEMKDL